MTKIAFLILSLTVLICSAAGVFIPDNTVFPETLTFNTVKKENAEAATPGETLIIGETFEIVIEGFEKTQEIRPDNTSAGYSYHGDRENETYLVVYGKIKNNTAAQIDLSFAHYSFFYDGRNKYNAYLETQFPDGDGFSNTIMPKEERKLIFYTSVDDETAKKDFLFFTKPAHDLRSIGKFTHETSGAAEYVFDFKQQ